MRAGEMGRQWDETEAVRRGEETRCAKRSEAIVPARRCDVLRWLCAWVRGRISERLTRGSGWRGPTTTLEDSRMVSRMGSRIRTRPRSE